jgi:hypothetical protein
MKTTLILLGLALLTSRGSTLVFTEPTTGTVIREKIDGKLNGEIIVPVGGLTVGGGMFTIEPADVKIEPAK